MGKIITNYKKEKLNIMGLKPNLFYYKVTDNSTYRGYNRVISVYGLCKGDLSPLFIGENNINTASYKGDYGSAVSIIGETFNLKNDGYFLVNKKIKLFQI